MSALSSDEKLKLLARDAEQQLDLMLSRRAMYGGWEAVEFQMLLYLQLRLQIAFPTETPDRWLSDLYSRHLVEKYGLSSIYCCQQAKDEDDFLHTMRTFRDRVLNIVRSMDTAMGDDGKNGGNDGGEEKAGDAG